MAKEVRYLRQVLSHLNKKYGEEKANEVMVKAQKRYDELLEENKDEPKEYYMHTRERIYPSIAVFYALIDEGVEREEAVKFITDYYAWRSESVASKIKSLFKIPGLYKIVPKFFYNMTEKSFGPKAGFSSEGKYLSKTEMRFNMVKCPYYDTCKKYGCTEIVKGFCDADDICYGSMHPRISWDRTKTIGHGDKMCDFKVHIKDKE